MKKVRRKQAHCLNCNHSFEDKEIRYCPKCGQENSNKRVSFGTLIMDFLGDYFTFDSRLFRSVGRLLVSPGYLTTAFNEGKRVPYIPPLRMLLLTGVIFFTILSYQYKNIEVDLNGRKVPISEIDKDYLMDGFTTDEIEKIQTKLELETDEAKKKEMLRTIDSIRQNFLTEIENDTSSNNFYLGNEKVNVSPGKFYRWSHELEPEQVADSLKVKSLVYRRLVIQTARIVKNSGDSLFSFFVGQLSIMILIMVPIVALLLKLLYVRHPEFFYIDHLVFTFHIQSFFYVMLSIYLLGVNWIPKGIIILLMIVYIFFALKKVYQQTSKKTFLKFSLMGFMYLICFFFFIILTFGFSFMMF